MKELRYNTETLGLSSADDSCYLDPSDPIHEFRRTGNATALNQPRRIPVAQQSQEHQRKLESAKAQGIRPGSPAWYML
jgi:hypothetical protein